MSRRRWPARVLLVSAAIGVTLAAVELGMRASNLATPPVFLPSESYGYLMAPDQTVSTRGIPIRINRLGLRGPEPTASAPEGVLRIAFLGDSITYGGGAVAEEDLFVRRLEARVGGRVARAVDALNVSAPGWGIANMAGYVDAVGLHGSRILLWVISALDLTRPKTFMEDHGFLDRRPMLRLTYLLWYARLRFFPPAGGPEPEWGERAVQTNARIVEELLERLARDVVSGVVFVPRREESESYRQGVAVFGERLRGLRIPWLDLADRLSAADRPALYLDHVHLNAEGHAAVAEALESFLLRLIENVEEGESIPALPLLDGGPVHEHPRSLRVLSR